MFSGSSDVDVIRTRISAGDDDNTSLYAYEPNTAAHAHNPGSNLSDIPGTQEQQKVVLEVLNHCQAIRDAIKKLDKKVGVINGKVTKIHRIRVKSLWQSHKPLGFAYRKYSYLLSRKTKLQKPKKSLSPLMSSPENKSYSPTVPVERRDNDSYNTVGSPYQSEDSLGRDQEALYANQDLSLSQSSSSHNSFSQSYRPYYTSDNPAQDYPSMPNYSSAGPQGTNRIVSSPQASTAVSTDILAQDRPSAMCNPEMITYPPLLENKSLNYSTSSVCIPAGYRGIDLGMLKQSCSGDPSTWSVEEVILFLKCMDPHIFTYLADLFRKHVMILMGKLCYYSIVTR
ncbi:PREDICTED: sex comb on midleg-like protein 1 isoform X2 [Hipposideros armiger]|uniref:Sex comb on midleg-like protein 1 isoform X2 n=1 Tax=Hipposideros armiger TaxID=186990 RepID=A0A8B7T9M0_HIPAR|nr:PREDICTED: sex comb on midleg-like protein 1 isoform X2 [Hipposideros armiger]